MKMNKRVLFLCRYAAVYGGNFIPSLVALEKELKKVDYDCVYVFPDEAKERFWFEELIQSVTTADTVKFSSSVFDFFKDMDLIIKKYCPCIVHTHFCSVSNVELYAILHRKIKIYIHLHSDFSGGAEGIRKKMSNLLTYKLLAFGVNFISVSEKYASVNPKKITYIPNAIASERIACQHVGGVQFGIGLASRTMNCCV